MTEEAEAYCLFLQKANKNVFQMVGFWARVASDSWTLFEDMAFLKVVYWRSRYGTLKVEMF